MQWGCALPHLQQVGVCLHYCSSSVSAQLTVLLGAVFGVTRRHPWRSISCPCIHACFSPLAKEKETELNINPSVNGEVRWENC